MSEVEITAYRPEFRDEVIVLALSAWDRVFPKTENETPRFVYDAFYPKGWRARQEADVAAMLDAEPETFWLARLEGEVAGFVGVRLHPKDQMGEIGILAVSPDRQRQGVGQALMAFAEQRVRQSGMKMIMVETLDDTGHAPARRAYEGSGYERWPVARYFKEL